MWQICLTPGLTRSHFRLPNLLNTNHPGHKVHSHATSSQPSLLSHPVQHPLPFPPLPSQSPKKNDSRLTTRMRNNPPLPPPTLLPPLLPLQPLDSVERAPRLERPDLLEVLALEPQPEPGSSRRPALLPPPRPLEAAGPGRRGYLVERRARQHGRAVDVRLYQLVGGLHAGAGQGRGGGGVCHYGCDTSEGGVIGGMW